MNINRKLQYLKSDINVFRGKEKRNFFLEINSRSRKNYLMFPKWKNNRRRNLNLSYEKRKKKKRIRKKRGMKKKSGRRIRTTKEGKFFRV